MSNAINNNPVKRYRPPTGFAKKLQVTKDVAAKAAYVGLGVLLTLVVTGAVAAFLATPAGHGILIALAVIAGLALLYKTFSSSSQVVNQEIELETLRSKVYQLQQPKQSWGEYFSSFF